jgi:hypothetical protein
MHCRSTRQENLRGIATWVAEASCHGRMVGQHKHWMLARRGVGGRHGGRHGGRQTDRQRRWSESSRVGSRRVGSSG